MAVFFFGTVNELLAECAPQGRPQTFRPRGTDRNSKFFSNRYGPGSHRISRLPYTLVPIVRLLFNGSKRAIFSPYFRWFLGVECNSSLFSKRPHPFAGFILIFENFFVFVRCV